MRDLANSVDTKNENARNIFSAPRDQISKVKVGSKLLFGKRQEKGLTIKTVKVGRNVKKLDLNSINHAKDDDSLFDVPDTHRGNRASF